jgi:hypothetical protein
MGAPLAGSGHARDTPNEEAIFSDGAERMISLPTRARQRLSLQMAAQGSPLIRSSKLPLRPWSSERVAEELVPIRDHLLVRLTGEIAAARDLSRDQRELVIDDAIDFLVTQYAKLLTSHEELDRAFWAAASFRVKRMHEGRGATVRAGFERVGIEELEEIEGGDNPEAVAVERDQELLLLEFATGLTDVEREVFACKYGSGSKVRGRSFVSRRLGLSVGAVRKAEREIDRKLERFVTMLSAGALCSFRWDAISSLAESAATPDQSIAARLHLARCPSCRGVYASHLRALRSGELPRRIASLLPLPPAAPAGQDRGLRSVVADWLSRPFTSDHVAAATQLTSSGAGRGAFGVLAAKLAALCLSGPQSAAAQRASRSACSTPPRQRHGLPTARRSPLPSARPPPRPRRRAS